jgi:hypothetical protein
MSIPAARPQVLDCFGTPLVIEPLPGQLNSDTGLLPIRQVDQRIGLTGAFTDALDDPRDPNLCEHSFWEMVRAHVYGILAGYADQNDHDTLRADSAFRLEQECRNWQNPGTALPPVYIGTAAQRSRRRRLSWFHKHLRQKSAVPRGSRIWHNGTTLPPSATGSSPGAAFMAVGTVYDGESGALGSRRLPIFGNRYAGQGHRANWIGMVS